MTLLSRLLFESEVATPSSGRTNLAEAVCDLHRGEVDELLALASSHHVIVRALEAVTRLSNGKTPLCANWVQPALAQERARIETAITFLSDICRRFEQHGLKVAVIKSLDHWPDIGSDLDLFTDAKPDEVIALMTCGFSASLAPRSWGDRLARKWNFLIPGLNEAVEIHVGRLGQTGEHVAFPSELLKSAHWSGVAGHLFLTPSSADRILISTLQRMYRHFYFRLCDIADTAALADAGGIDYEALYAAARNAGIWEGVAAYLTIVSDYVTTYRGYPLDLPTSIVRLARLRGSDLFFKNGFLRVPILPQCARLYGSQLADTLRRGELKSSARLSVLPWLATAALVGERITGSDKGIW